MARAKTRKKSQEPLPQADPRATLDGQVLLEAAGPVLRQLEEDLLERARGSQAMTRALTERHGEERDAKRTADPFDVWQRAFVEQVAAAWFLSCVFVRTLEDRGLVERRRLAGSGAADSQRSFFELGPSLTERDYLLTVFRELEHFEATRDLFDSRHNPVWLLAPSAEASKTLLALFRQPSAEEPGFRFGGADTRFLGDLYQDLSESVRSRYALLQTPRFVEAFILDRTLEPAIERFGLDQTTIIDPTCGSGHFLLGAFERLFDHKLRAEPGLSGREAARWALGAVHGVDINPYAVAIARFRLTLAFLEKAGYQRLSDAPAVHLNLAVADSLLENPGTPTLATLAGQRPESWFGAEFSLEEPAWAREILGKRHAAVVGNPPYITVKNAAKRDLYRQAYPRSAFREYSLAAPFTECFFQLARRGGRIGMITANSFMKREFGKRLIQEYLSTVNLDRIINTSGAFIPGHGTPTVLLFGSAEEKQGTEVEVVLASRGEPSTPEDPEKGLVWSSIAEHWNDVGFDNEFISVARVERTTLEKHPWSLGGGGAAELKELLEERAETRLGEVAKSIGFMCITKQDDVFSNSTGVFARQGVETSWLREFVIGEHVRDWAISSDLDVFFPYETNATLKQLAPAASGAQRMLWPYRTVLESRAVFGGKTFRQAGRRWYEYGQIPTDRVAGPAITFAFIATHNHFVLDRGDKVFNRSAPIIKLPESATEEDHLALLAYLNSSTACFWMKQVFHDKGSGTDTGKWQAERAKIAYEFTGTGLDALPVPAFSSHEREALCALASRLLDLATERSALMSELLPSWDRGADLPDRIEKAKLRDETILGDMIAAQERLDWLVYEAFGLCALGLASRLPGNAIRIGARAFEVAQARSGLHLGIDGQILDASGAGMDEFVDAIQQSSCLSVIERPEYKRRWQITPKSLAGRVLTFEDRLRQAATDVVAQSTEVLLQRSASTNRCVAARAVVDDATRDAALKALFSAGRLGGEEPASHIQEVLMAEAVPYLAGLRFSASGMDKYNEWLAVWSLQRREDAGEAVKIRPPPRYSPCDFLSARFDDLRGKLDVPKERFISYPGCESDEDGQPIYGWAGWNHLQRAQALAALYQDRKTREGWEKARLVPMLAGLLELIPWVKQWHNEPSAEYNGLKLGDYFEGFLKGECAELGVTEEDLRAWRPPQRRAGSKAAKSTREPTDPTSPESASAKPRRRRQQPAEDE
jgi:hypothetical protein